MRGDCLSPSHQQQAPKQLVNLEPEPPRKPYVHFITYISECFTFLNPAEHGPPKSKQQTGLGLETSNPHPKPYTYVCMYVCMFVWEYVFMYVGS